VLVADDVTGQPDRCGEGALLWPTVVLGHKLTRAIQDMGEDAVGRAHRRQAGPIQAQAIFPLAPHRRKVIADQPDVLAQPPV